MARKQIKELLIVTETKGAKEAQAELKDLDNTIKDINKGVTSFNKRAKNFSESITTLSRRSGTLTKNLAGVVKSAQGINRAFAGSATQTAKLEGYITNLEVLSSILLDLARDANVAEAALDGINETVGMRSLISILDQIETNTGKTSNRIKQARDNITDLDVTANRTGETLEDFWRGSKLAGLGVETLGKNSAKTNNDLRRLNQGGRSSAKSFSQLAFASNPLVNAYAAIAVNIFAVTEAFRLLNEASQFDRLQGELAGFSAAISGLDVRALASDMQEASAGALSLKESLSFASRGTAFNFTTDQLNDLTIGARKASIALGRDFNDSLDRVLKGISKQEIELFDELGIVTRLTPAFQKYAAQVGKTVDELTDYERQLALTNEVQSQLDEKFKGIDVAATSFETFAVSVKNGTDNLLIAISKGLDPVLSFINKIIDRAGVMNDILRIADTSNSQADLFAETLKAENVGASFNALASGQKDLENLRKELNDTTNALLKFEREGVSIQNRLKDSGFNILNAVARTVGAIPNSISNLVSDEEDGIYQGIDQTVSKLKTLTGNQEAWRLEYEKYLSLIEEEAKLSAQVDKQSKLLADRQGIPASIINEETGRQILAYSKGLEDIATKTLKFSSTNSKALGPLGEIANGFKNLEKEVEGFKSFSVAEQLNIFEGKLGENGKRSGGLTDSLELADSIDTLGKLTDTTKELNTELNNLSFSDSLGGISTGAEGEAVAQITNQINRRLSIQQKSSDLGKLISLQDKDKLDKEIKLLEAKRDQLIIDQKLQRSIEITKKDSAIEIDNLTLKRSFASENLKLQVASLEAQIAKTEASGVDTRQLEDQLAILKNKLRVEKESEKLQLMSNDRTAQSNILNRNLGLAGSEKDKVKIRQDILNIRKAEAKTLTDEVEINRENLAIALEEENLKRSANAAPFADASSLFSSLQGLTGLSDLQSTGLGMAENFTNVFAQAEESGKGFTEFLMSNSEAFSEFGISLANSANAIFTSLSDSKIESLDREIAAEKRRDGNSEQSLAKIKKLEAKKIKEQAKSNKASVVMSTATAIMKGYADLGPIAGTISAAVLLGLGAMQMSSINKAANGQLAALDGGGSTGMSIEGGNRSNSIDVSRSASGGEIDYLRGENYNTPGRMGGGSSGAGASINVGERGVETVTPSVPVAVTPAGNSNPALPRVTLSPVYNITTVDSTGMQSLMETYSAELYAGLEKELLAKNLTLENLG